MLDKNFEDRLKSALEKIEVPYDPASWDMLDKKIDAQFVEESPEPVHPVDKAVYSVLNKLDEHYNNQHWQVMARKLDDLAKTKRRVLYTKLAEAAIFLLLLINLDGLISGGSNSIQNQNIPASVPSVGPIATDARKNSPEKNIITYLPASKKAEQTPSLSAQIVNFMERIGLPLENKAQQDIIPPQVIISAPIAQSFPSENSILDGHNFYTKSGLVKLPVTINQPIVYNFDCEIDPKNKLINPVRSTNAFFASFASFDQYFINSAAQKNQYANLGGGIRVGWKKRDWTIESGVSLHSFAYTPKKEVEIYAGNSSNGFYGSHADIVAAEYIAVPAIISKKIAKIRNTQIRVLVGANANFATQQNYHYANTYYPGPAPSTLSAGNEPKLRKNGQGLLENGKIKDNFFLTATAGVRIEQPIGKRYTAFLEPTYQSNPGNSSIGIHNAQINSFSIRAGVMASL